MSSMGGPMGGAMQAQMGMGGPMGPMPGQMGPMGPMPGQMGAGQMTHMARGKVGKTCKYSRICRDT